MARNINYFGLTPNRLSAAQAAGTSRSATILNQPIGSPQLGGRSDSIIVVLTGTDQSVPSGNIAFISNTQQYYNVSSTSQNANTGSVFTDTSIWRPVGDGNTVTQNVSEFFNNIPDQPSSIADPTVNLGLGDFFNSNGNTGNTTGVYRVNQNYSGWGTSTTFGLFDTGISFSPDGVQTTSFSIDSGVDLGALEHWTARELFEPGWDALVRGTRNASMNATYQVLSPGGQTVLSTHTGEYQVFQGNEFYFWGTLLITNGVIQVPSSGGGLFTWGDNATDPINAENRINF